MVLAQTREVWGEGALGLVILAGQKFREIVPVLSSSFE